MCHCIRQDGFATSLRAISPSLLKSGSVAKWGLPFQGGTITAGAGDSSAARSGGRRSGADEGAGTRTAVIAVGVDGTAEPAHLATG